MLFFEITEELPCWPYFTFFGVLQPLTHSFVRIRRGCDVE